MPMLDPNVPADFSASNLAPYQFLNTTSGAQESYAGKLYDMPLETARRYVPQDTDAQTIFQLLIDKQMSPGLALILTLSEFD